MARFRKRITSLRSVLPKMSLDALLFAVAYSVSFKARLETIDAPQLQTLLVSCRCETAPPTSPPSRSS